MTSNTLRCNDTEKINSTDNVLYTSPVKGKVIPTFNYIIMNYSMKVYGEAEV
jgi:hypothetical protein